jgi:hypothetical protein
MKKTDVSEVRAASTIRAMNDRPDDGGSTHLLFLLIFISNFHIKMKWLRYEVRKKNYGFVPRLDKGQQFFLILNQTWIPKKSFLVLRHATVRHTEAVFNKIHTYCAPYFVVSK